MTNSYRDVESHKFQANHILHLTARYSDDKDGGRGILTTALKFCHLNDGNLLTSHLQPICSPLI